MKKINTSINKSKSKSVVRSASAGLLDFLQQKYQRTIPLSFVTAAHKLYGHSRLLTKDDRYLKRFSDGKGNIDTTKFIQQLKRNDVQERGKGLNEEALRRVYGNCSNHDGKLTFEYIMKMADSCGVTINERTAKAMVRKYGGQKDHMSFEDCMKVNRRRADTGKVARRQ